MVRLTPPSNTVYARNWAIILLSFLLLTAACDGIPPAETDPSPQSAVTAQPVAQITPSLESYPVATPTEIPSAYPLPSPTPLLQGYPAPTTVTESPTPKDSASPTPTPTRLPPVTPASGTDLERSYLPLILRIIPTATTVPTPAPTPTIAALDFPGIMAGLHETGQELAFSKMGFHVTLLEEEEKEALYGHLRALDEAGVPFFLKSASNAEPLYFAQGLAAASGVPHTLVYRSTIKDVPHYELAPDLAAEVHWQMHRDVFPPELDPSLVWIETVNEVDRTRSEWLAQFALKTAELALADGFRWAAFGWASGEPEPEHWQTPAMLAFLRLAAANPDRLAIALHEYSYTIDEIGHEYPHKVGRFQELFEIADRLGIPRPTILITEWGWTYDTIPSANRAMRDIRWAASLYAPFPEVKGAAIWNLGVLGSSNTKPSDDVLPLIPSLTEFSLTNYFVAPMPPNHAPPNPDLYAP